ncbi:MAG: hypothetical protein A2639_02980 [Candidatus Staskawiczbacteria bacterium RIFCSPHIGHO2_01_FULL_34_27]|uniref:Nudix hydrolase domain-containing protein n=2 Tax=Candidatus Staskawicziibacteriota TaxID=1817916 RepID=A0A1G2HJE9_9BACT|nr:MAG: hypothetical protein UR31_C0009G0002 [Parcubacteria group bacterium GW2011_GWA2_33_14]OGZ62573.1 MAG: hypothetical protein A2639_02980 [Candidatus Staskawiczbacteria bacterium RIFCSPHIGHO2_01_FULL_34_27]OGZ66818.1 MAG: hypothetical protein A3D34_00600 [Candidatus Staskawiczbacteria bacterium RIFCSPHIGHO2_02_FULL_33_16]OGZ70447.1 MAG: hypothetical protein A2980_03675 [Candidatus Staskawiczbacteria bacterium RIFCSPLOWO2_01_FULL_33_13]
MPNNIIQAFPKDFWEQEQSNIEFILTDDAPADIPFTAVKMLLFDDHKLLLTKVPRGWDIPTGHKEEGEDIAEAVKRETLEETGVVANQMIFIGYLKLIKAAQNEQNKKYPPVSAIGVFVCKDFTVSDFSEPLHEATERCFQEIDKIGEIHHSWSSLMESIMWYAYKHK